MKRATAEGEALWTGWPAVVTTDGGKRVVAPLLVRRVEAVITDSGETRLDKVLQLLEGRGGERVRVGTVHTFQGGECDIMVFSLVAAGNVPAHMFNWFDSQARLWNVAITRARSSLIIVGDRELWRQRGGIGGELLSTAEGRAPSAVEDEQLRVQLYRLLRSEDPGVELARVVHGYRTDAVLSDGTAVLLDQGVPDGGDPAVHMERMLRRRTLLAGDEGQPARRLPLWRLFDQES